MKAERMRLPIVVVLSFERQPPDEARDVDARVFGTQTLFSRHYQIIERHSDNLMPLIKPLEFRGILGLTLERVVLDENVADVAFPFFISNLDLDIHPLDVAADELEMVVDPSGIHDRPAEIAIHGDAPVRVNHLVVVELDIREQAIRHLGADDKRRLDRPDDIVADLNVVHIPASAVAKLHGETVVVVVFVVGVVVFVVFWWKGFDFWY